MMKSGDDEEWDHLLVTDLRRQHWCFGLSPPDIVQTHGHSVGYGGDDDDDATS